MKGKTIEEIQIDRIERGIKAIRGLRKSPKDAQLSGCFEKLKPLNVGMHDDLMKKYGSAVKHYKKNVPEYLEN